MSKVAPICAMLLSSVITLKAADDSVLAEFRQMATRQGWLLAKFNFSHATILLLGTGSEQSLQLSSGYSVYQFASSASGDCLAFSVSDQISTWDDTVFVVGPNGTRSSTKGHFGVVKGLAVSPDCHKVAIDGVYQEIDPISHGLARQRAGLFLADVRSGRENVRLVAGLPELQSYFGVSDAVFAVSWSPGSDLVAYSTNGAIHTYDISRGTTKFLIAGSGPAWSPDGRWVGYQGPDGAPMVLNLASGHSGPLVKGAKCLRSIKWSPDATFAIFTQVDGAGTVFQVCRLKDRSVAPFYRSGAQYREDRFGWITRSVLGTILAPGERVKNN